MKAVADHYTIEQLVELGVRAGLDHLLICHTEAKWRAAHAHLVQLGDRDAAFAARLDDAAARVAALKQLYFASLPAPWRRATGWRDVLGCDAHRALLSRLNPAPAQGIDPTEA
jgi:beta-glucosidase-like glycosyl hydrolase